VSAARSSAGLTSLECTIVTENSRPSSFPARRGSPLAPRKMSEDDLIVIGLVHRVPAVATSSARSKEMATTAAALSRSRRATSHVNLVDETRRTYRHHGRQRGAPRRIATFRHATLRVAPHRYATREPLGHLSGSRALSSSDIPWRKSVGIRRVSRIPSHKTDTSQRDPVHLFRIGTLWAIRTLP
jgi:hypothetical protein